MSKVRESGMPEEAYWESLFDVPLILESLGINRQIGDVIELGCGYGTFTLAVAQRISGRVLTFDVEPEMIRRTRERAERAGLHNVVCQQRDVLAEGYGLPEESVDGCLLFNILHCEHPGPLLRESSRPVRSGGWIWAIHWRHDPSTPRGPSLTIRPRPEQIRQWAEEQGLTPVGGMIDLPPWHYGWRFRKPGQSPPASA